MTRKYVKKGSAEDPVTKTEFQMIQSDIQKKLEVVSKNISNHVFLTRYQLAKKLSENVFKIELREPKLNKFVGTSLFLNIHFHLNLYMQNVSFRISMGEKIPRELISGEIQDIVMSSTKVTERIGKIIYNLCSTCLFDISMSDAIELAEDYIHENESSFSVDGSDLILTVPEEEILVWVKSRLKEKFK